MTRPVKHDFNGAWTGSKTTRALARVKKCFKYKTKKRLDVFYSNFDIVKRSSKAAFCLYKGCSLTSTNIL